MYKISQLLVIDKVPIVRNLRGIYFLAKRTVEMFFLASAKALVARNFLGALLSKKGTVK